MIHFWLPHPPLQRELEAWDPDAEPWRYASGVGHNLLELFVRLQRAGFEASIGADVPPQTALLVVFLKSAFEKRPPRRRSFRAALAAVGAARGRFVLIRSDAPPEWQFPIRPLREFVATRAMQTHPWQRCLPPLPQRGLQPRDPGRHGQVRSVAWKGNPPSIHPDLLTREWEEALRMRGLEWILDMPAHTDGSDQRWHDFSDVDVMLCCRTPEHVQRWGAAKPPTRLVNSWASGAIPLVSREPAYLELATDGDDALFIDSVWEALDVVDRLRHDRDALARVEEGGRRRAAEFTTHRIVRSWGEALIDAASEPKRGIVGRSALSLSIASSRASVALEQTTLPTRQRVRTAGSQLRARTRSIRVSRLRIGTSRGSEEG